MTSYITNAVTYLLNPPAFRAVGTAGQSVPANPAFTPTWVVQEDTVSGFSTAHNYYIAQVPGWYAVSSVLTLAGASASAIGSYSLVLGISGIQQPPVMFTRSQVAVTPHSIGLYADVYLQNGDWVYPLFQSNSTSATTVSSPASYTSFEVTWFGA